jgi:hypothetical protein
MAHVADPEQPEPVFAEPQERHRCRNGHALKTFEIPNDSFVFVCDLCGSDLAKGSTSYTCWVCNYDVCLNCFNKDEAVTLKRVDGPEVEMGDLYFTPRAVVPPIVEGIAAQKEAGFTIAMQHRPLTVPEERHRCRNGHALQKYEAPADDRIGTCDPCGSELAKGSTTYACRACNNDMCLNCFSKEDEDVDGKLGASILSQAVCNKFETEIETGTSDKDMPPSASEFDLDELTREWTSDSRGGAASSATRFFL